MDNSIQEKIKHLLSLANNNANENEASAAMAAANKLAEKYRIEIALLEVNDNSSTEEVIKAEEAFISGGRIRNWKVILLNSIVKSQGCVCFSTRNGRSHYATTNYYVFGRSSDIEISRTLFTYALNQLEFIGTLACKGKGKRYANSWYIGAVNAISEGLKKGKMEARQNVNTTALSIVDNRVKESDKVMRASLGKLSTKKLNSKINSEAYYAGHSVGSRMSLNNNFLK